MYGIIALQSPIHEQAIPEVLAGRDIFGIAQTSTGKTAAFVYGRLRGITIPCCCPLLVNHRLMLNSLGGTVKDKGSQMQTPCFTV